MKVKDLKNRLKVRGCRFLRRGKGSHEIWETSAGVHFSFPASGTSQKITPVVLGSVNRALRQGGLELWREGFGPLEPEASPVACPHSWVTIPASLLARCDTCGAQGRLEWTADGWSPVAFKVN